MEKIVLGLLLIKEMTGYEVRCFIKNHLSQMCSDSAGSLQTALQKLLEAQLISYMEHVEKGVNKKVYSITQAGRDAFFKWLNQPMNHKKAKNMELAKLFFLGTLEEEKRLPLLLEYIHQVSMEHELLLGIRDGILQSEGAKLTEYAKDREMADRFKYQMATLDYGIAIFEFEMEWYGKLVKDLKEGHNYELGDQGNDKG